MTSYWTCTNCGTSNPEEYDECYECECPRYGENEAELDMEDEDDG